MSTDADHAVLESIFNPLLPLGSTTIEDVTDTNYQESVLPTPVKLRCIELERAAIAESETGSLEKALELLNEAVALAPGRASGYNNRAQIHRLLGDTASAMADLDTAISASGGRGFACSQALAQRGALLRHAGREREAMKDWQQAAALGSRFARAQLAKANPYAAMCNQMLGQMMAQLQ